MSQTVVFDFDGVIHSYTSGWKGETCIPDPPVPGIKEAIDEIRAAGYLTIIQSTRAATIQGKYAINKYLAKNGIIVDGITAEKVPAIVYIDDRAITFNGDTSNLLARIQAFQPWTKQGPHIQVTNVSLSDDQSNVQQTMPDNKICPILSVAAHIAKLIGNNDMTINCQGKECAWWCQQKQCCRVSIIT